MHIIADSLEVFAQQTANLAANHRICRPDSITSHACQLKNELTVSE